jgi:hypothetical protein
VPALAATQHFRSDRIRTSQRVGYDVPRPDDRLPRRPLRYEFPVQLGQATFRVERLSLRLWLIGVDLIRAVAGDASDDDGRRLERERLADSAVGTAITLGVPAFLVGISALLPAPTPTTKRRLPNPVPNDLSIATWIRIGDVQILLGADLEEHGVEGRGWTAVLASNTRPLGLASLFKIAHHGSVTGHHDGVWAEMLAESPIAVLTPWTLGASQLPQRSDVDRINGLTANAYSTSRLRAAGVQLPSEVRKTLEEGGIRIRHAEPPTGYLQLTNRLPGRGHWTVTRSNESVRLSEISADAFPR